MLLTGGVDGDNYVSSTAKEEKNTKIIAASAAKVTTSSSGTTASIVNRYKMERKNSQQGTEVGSKVLAASSLAGTIPSIQSYSSSIIQTILRQDNVRVKIADLGNACYEVINYVF